MTTGIQLPAISGASATSRIRIHSEAFNAKSPTAIGRKQLRKTAYVFAVNFRFRGTDFLQKPLERVQRGTRELIPVIFDNNYITGM